MTSNSAQKETNRQKIEVYKPILKDLMDEWFDLNEIKTLCTDLKQDFPKLDYENIPYNGKDGKIIGIISYCSRYKGLEGLKALAREMVRRRPDQPWPEDLAVQSPYCDLRTLQRFIKNNCSETQLKELAKNLKYEKLIGRNDLLGNTAVLVFETAEKEPPEITTLIGEIIHLHPDIDWQIDLNINSPYRLPDLATLLIREFNEIRLHDLFDKVGAKDSILTGYSRHHKAIDCIFKLRHEGRLENLVTETYGDCIRAKGTSSISPAIVFLIAEMSSQNLDINWQTDLQINGLYPLSDLIHVLINEFDKAQIGELFQAVDIDYTSSGIYSQHHRDVTTYGILELWRSDKLDKFIMQAAKKYPEQFRLIQSQIDTLPIEVSAQGSGELKTVKDQQNPEPISQSHQDALLFLWLQKKHRFTQNPFRYDSFHAEQDPIFLWWSTKTIEPFVRFPNYEEDIKGKSVLESGARFILGDSGTGKTLLYRHLANDFNVSLGINLENQPQILAVKHIGYLDYEKIINVNDHARLIVYSMWYQIIKHKQFVARKEKLISRLKKLALDEKLTANNIFEEMTNIGQLIGLKGICVLVDITNVKSDDNLETGFQRIKGLATRYDLLTIPGLIFKFFLPTDLMNMYQEDLPIDKFEPYILQWSKEHLQDMLTARISFCRQQEGEKGESREMVWGSFIDLFDQQSQFELFEEVLEGDKYKMRLKDSELERIQFNPRQLLALCRQKLQKKPAQ